MSSRLILIAALGQTPDALEQRLPGLGEPRTGGGWSWLRLNPWGLDRQQLEAGLAGLDVPALYCAAEDDCRWYLQLWRGGELSLSVCMHQALLGGDAYEQEPEFDSLGQLLDDYNELVPAQYHPPRAIQPLRELPVEQGLPRWLSWQAEAVADALARLDLPHQRDAVLDCVAGRSLAGAERNWPLGNLPRLLDCLGLPALPDWEQELQQYVELEQELEQEAELDQLDDEELDDQLDEEASDEEVVEQVLELGQQLELEPLGQGPLELATSGLEQLRLLGWFCDQDTELALRLRLGADAALTWPGLEQLGRALHDGVLVDALEGGRIVSVGLRPISIWDEQPWLALLGRMLAALPEGSEVDLACCSPLDDHGAADQRYQGQICDGAWQLEQAAPARQREELELALALCAQVEGVGPVLANSEQEAAAVVATAASTLELQQRGERLICSDDARREVVRLLFRQRHGHSWVLEPDPATQAELPDAEEMSLAFIEAGQAIGGMLSDLMDPSAPDGELLLQGQASQFFRADLQQRAQDNPLLKLAGMLGQGELESGWTMDSVETEMQALGLGRLGDLVCDKFPNVPMRGYAAPEGDTYGTLVSTGMGETFPEFYSQFDDGASLITSVKEATPDPERGLHKRTYQGQSLAELYAEHRLGVEELTQGGARALTVEPNLAGLAAAIDAYLVRRG